MKRDPLYREVPDSFDARVPAHANQPIPRARTYRVVLLILFGVLTAILISPVPKYSAFIAQCGVSPPGPTENVCAVSRFVVDCPWVWITSGLALVWIMGGWMHKRAASLLGPALFIVFLLEFWVIWEYFYPPFCMLGKK